MVSPKPHELKKLPVTKLDAARRQLETAITLWFHEADPVSIHTLTMAAHGILKGINRQRGGRPMLGEPSPNIRPGFEKEVAKIFLEASNFFKHGARDPLQTHFFAPESNQAMLLDGCEILQALARERRPLMDTLILYLAIHEPRFFKAEFVNSIRSEPYFSNAKRLSKRQFFAEWFPIASMIPNIT